MERKAGLIEHTNGSELFKRIDKDTSPHLLSHWPVFMMVLNIMTYTLLVTLVE